jgi:hypothetical protein
VGPGKDNVIYVISVTIVELLNPITLVEDVKIFLIFLKEPGKKKSSGFKSGDLGG